MPRSSSLRRRDIRLGATPLALALAAGCFHGPAVRTDAALPLRKVVVYRNGIGYFERRGEVRTRVVQFRVLQREVGDFLATLAVMERGGSSVRAAAFPLPPARTGDEEPDGNAPRVVRLALDGSRHDLVVGYTVETPIWRPTYRLVFGHDGAQLQAWGIVQNLSGEDWNDVHLSLVAGAPVSFRAQLARAVIPTRPEVTDEGTVIDIVPTTETTLAQDNAGANTTPRAPQAAPATEAEVGGGGTGEGTIGLGSIGTIGHGAGTGSGQGYGSGAGRGLRSRGNSGPLVRAAPPSVQGLLSPEVIRRVVLRNLGQVAHCHEQGLAQNPNASGRVVIRFIISAAGAVAGSNVAESSYPLPSTSECIANAVRRWQFPAPEGGGVVAVSYPFTLQSPDGENAPAEPAMGSDAAPQTAPSPTSAPRDLSSLAALSLQGGVTRYDLPATVSIPDRTATMVMLISADVQGQRLYLFAPNAGVPASATHPFQVARFVNHTGGMLERGPVAIFEAGAYLGEGMVDALPDAATTTIPFALEPGLSVENSSTDAVEGARLLTMRRDQLTLERFNVHRTTYYLRNGLDRVSHVLLRHDTMGADLYEPPAGTERANGSAMVPADVPPHGQLDVLVTTRSAFTLPEGLDGEQARDAIERYIHDAAPPAALAQTLRTALDQQQQLVELTRQRADLDQRRSDLQTSTEETRENLLAIQRNRQAGDLRARLTARLAAAAIEVDQVTRRMVEMDTQLSERRVRLTEALREVDIDVSRSSASPRP